MSKNPQTVTGPAQRTAAVTAKLVGKMVRQQEMDELRNVQDETAAIKRRLKTSEELEKSLGAVILSKLELGAPQEPGYWTAGIDEKSRTAPKWKEAFEREMGPDAVTAEIAKTEPSVTRKVFVVKAEGDQQ